jgi:DNA polymerase I
MNNRKFVIVDAMALAYKAYFAFINRPLITTKGEPTSAVYGFLTQLIKILEDTKPDYMAVAFDSAEKTFRHERFENYKSSRMEMPDDLGPQLKRIKEIINAMNIPLYILSRYEADDIIGTAVCKAEEAGLESFVITPDKDFIQLITDKVKLIRPGKSADEVEVYDVNKVKNEFGFAPKQMIDYLALIGDKSDDIPGVAGIGPKGAIPLIQQYGSVEGIYEHIDEIDKPALKNKLIAGKENAFISKELATIHCLVPLEFNFDATKIKSPDFDTLRTIFVDLEFTNLYSKFLNFYRPRVEAEVKEEINIEPPASYDSGNVSYKVIKTLQDAAELKKKLMESDLVVFDTETDSLDMFELRLAGVSFSTKGNEGYFVAVNPYKDRSSLFDADLSDRISIADFADLFKPLFEDSSIKKVCQNAKFDIAVLRNYGIEVNNFYFDTMLASYVLDPDQKHGMDELAKRYLQYKTITLKELLGEKKNSLNIFNVNLTDLSCYSCEDADVTYRLYEVLSKEVEKNNLTKLAYEVEFPLVPVLEDMERTGIKVDPDVLYALSKDLQILLDNYTMKIFKCCGEEFNINSPQQLQRILFDKLGLKTGKKTKTGFSTDAKSLEGLRGEHEVVDTLLEYRQISKLKSTYADSLPNLIRPATGRVHTSFNQTVVSTGRLSSTDPNLQNIPIRSDMGKEIRRAFVPADKNHVILSADYSQIELRIMAGICGDEHLTKAFRQMEDIHRSTAALVFMVKPEDVTSEMRRRAKEVNFGILYGIGVFGLKTRLGVTQSHAKEIIDTYFNTFKRVKKFMDDSVILARERGYAQTLLGRRRYLRNINSSNRVVRQFEERVAINMPIQGTAADMIKLAMINIHKMLVQRKAKTKMILQVHDELVFDAHKDEIDELQPLIKEIMENALPMNVPVVAETGIGDNWLDAH